MRAIWNNEVVAEEYDNVIVIEGNHYFPPNALNREFFLDSDHATTCHWKGDAKYYHLRARGHQTDNAAWYYPLPKAEALERVGRDFSNYVSFGSEVEIVD